MFGVRERFRAAVPLVAHIMMLTIGTLNFVRDLHKSGILSGLDAAFDTEVVLSETTFRAEGQVFLSAPDSPGQPVTVPTLGENLGDGWKSIHEVLDSPSPAHAPNEFASAGQADLDEKTC